MDKVRLGIIGMGNMGSGHMQSIIKGECPRIEVTAFADIGPQKLERAAGQHPTAKAFGDALQM